jgi:hypothetical protein
MSGPSVWMFELVCDTLFQNIYPMPSTLDDRINRFARRNSSRLLAGIILFGLALSCFQNLRPSTLIHQIVHFAFTDRNILEGQYLNIDQIYATRPFEGNVHLQWQDFTASDDDLLSLVYFRSVYTLYPRRIIVSDPSITINRGRDILTNTFAPDGAWLDKNNVRQVITVTRKPDGSVSSSKVERTQSK